jgi:hypothetical protein
MSARQLRLAQLGMMVVFYAISSILHPSRLLAYVKSLFTGRETTAVDQLIRVKRKGFKRLEPPRDEDEPGPPFDVVAEPEPEREPVLGPAA